MRIFTTSTGAGNFSHQQKFMVARLQGRPFPQTHKTWAANNSLAKIGHRKFGGKTFRKSGGRATKYRQVKIFFQVKYISARVPQFFIASLGHFYFGAWHNPPGQLASSKSGADNFSHGHWHIFRTYKKIFRAHKEGCLKEETRHHFAESNFFRSHPASFS